MPKMRLRNVIAPISFACQTNERAGAGAGAGAAGAYSSTRLRSFIASAATSWDIRFPQLVARELPGARLSSNGRQGLQTRAAGDDPLLQLSSSTRDIVGP